MPRNPSQVGKLSRNKGASFERKIAKLFQRVYPGAKRGIGQARSASEVPDVDGSPWWVEAKHRDTVDLNKAWDQAFEARRAGTTGNRMPIVIVWQVTGSRRVNATVMLRTLCNMGDAGIADADLERTQRSDWVVSDGALATVDLTDFLDMCLCRNDR